MHKIRIYNADIAELVLGAILSRHRTVDALENATVMGPWRFWDRGEIDKSLQAFFSGRILGELAFLVRESGRGTTSEGQKLVSRAIVSEAEYLEGLSQDAVDRR